MTEMSVRQWQERFRAGDFNSRDLSVQCEAGWFDWFCRNDALAGRLKKLSSAVLGIKAPFILDNYYVWFKNNCPMAGPLYERVASQYDPDGFRLYFAAQEITGIKRLWEEYPYEDACGRFTAADGHELLRYLTAAYFKAVAWEIVPGTTYEKAILGKVDTSTPEYIAFEKRLYETVLERMGFRERPPQLSGRARMDHATGKDNCKRGDAR